jgi:hypothetical protein
MADQTLVAHRSSALAARVAVTAGVEIPSATLIRFTYRLEGELARLAIPARAAAQRAERLWEHTCFEAFVAAGTGTHYYELNFAPSTQWAAYEFDGYRQGMRALALAVPPSITVVGTQTELRVTASVERAVLGDAPWPRRVGLTAVVEDRAGVRGYFALAHPRDQPDFHDAAGFTVTLDGSAR